ncbi:MAG: HAMP domain-containing sensor histidine kinase [Bdellovibrionota bacterium]
MELEKLAFNNSTDPIAILNLSGQAVYTNSSLLTLLNKAGLKSITDLFKTEELEKIYSSVDYQQIELKLSLQKNCEIPQTLVVINLTQGDPNKDLYLIVFKSASSQIAEALQQQEMLVTAAHDIKNPIGAVLGYADILLDLDDKFKLADKSQEIILRIRSAANRALNILRNYQYLSDRRLKNISNSHSRVDLCLVLKRLLESLRVDPDVTASISTNLPDQPVLVKSTRTEIERLISNLLSNAIKFTPTSGSIRIEVKDDSELPELIISNTDAYISEDRLAGIFEMFNRSNPSQNIPGTGLGLYIVKKITDALGGELSLISNQETGTQISIKIPRAK